MSSLFSSYRLIDSRNIVRDNIRLESLQNDLQSLIRALNPLYILSTSGRNDGTILPDSIVKPLESKEHTNDLLVFFGYECNRAGKYVYKTTENETVKRRRESGISEFRQFFQELRLQNNHLEKLVDFLLTDDVDDDEDIPLPSTRDVEQGNNRTSELIKSFKTSIVPKYKGGATHAFIRRRIARLLFKQIYPDARYDDDDTIDSSIDRLIRSLKQRDTENEKPRTDDIYMECLIRSQFNHQGAYEMLTNNRPHLEAPIIPQISKKPSIDNLIGPAEQQVRLLASHRFTSSSDKMWNRAEFLIPAILKIRAQCPDDQADEATFCKLKRLLLSELPPIVGTTIVFNIDIFTRMLCEKSSETIKNIDVGSLRTFLTASNATAMVDTFLVDCPLCYETYPRSRLETPFLCQHSCCSDCMKDYYRTAINNVQDASSIGALTCYEERHPITEDTHHLFFTWLQTQIRRWFPDDKDLQDRYIDRVTNVVSGKQLKQCGNSKCGSSFFADDNPRPTRVHCPNCNFTQCSQCFRKWTDEHKNRSCDEYGEWLYDNDPDDDYVKLLQSVAKTAIVCPQCKEIFDYQPGGCEHFKCTKCNTEFCRMCSSLFYFAQKQPHCPIANCTLKNTIHAHCPSNCFRAIRDADYPTFCGVLQKNGINPVNELRSQFPNTREKCPTEECGKDTIPESENRLCRACYQQFLSAFIWYRGIEPWELYEDHQLEQILKKASITIPQNSNRQALIQLCQRNLNKNLGKPHVIKRSRS